MAVKKSCGDPADGYQISFTVNNYSIQEKCGGSLIGSPQIFSYPSGVTGSTSSSFIFKPLTGEVGSSDTTITLTLKSKAKTVTIKANGEIE